MPLSISVSGKCPIQIRNLVYGLNEQVNGTTLD